MFFINFFKFIGDIVVAFEPDAWDDFNGIFKFLGLLFNKNVDDILYTGRT